MAEAPSLDLSEATLPDRRSHLIEPLFPVLEIKPMTLVLPSTGKRRQSGKERRHLKRHSEPYSNDQSKASENFTRMYTAQDDDRSKSPDMQSCKLVKRLSPATFPDDFPELAPVKRKLSLCLSPPLCNTPQKNAAAEVCVPAEWVPITMQYAQLMPPPEYMHQCMPVSYRLKASPVTTDQLNVIKLFEDLRFALSSRPTLQVSHSKRESTNCCTGMQRFSSLKSRPPTRIVSKTPRTGLIPIANLSVKSIPKVRS